MLLMAYSIFNIETVNVHPVTPQKQLYLMFLTEPSVVSGTYYSCGDSIPQGCPDSLFYCLNSMHYDWQLRFLAQGLRRLECDVTWSERNVPKFWRNMLPPFQGKRVSQMWKKRDVEVGRRFVNIGGLNMPIRVRKKVKEPPHRTWFVQGSCHDWPSNVHITYFCSWLTVLLKWKYPNSCSHSFLEFNIQTYIGMRVRACLWFVERGECEKKLNMDKIHCKYRKLMFRTREYNLNFKLFFLCLKC
jgi:hypothetical protein